MESIEGIERLHMSGARAVFVPASERAIDEGTLASAFADKGMELEVYEQVTRPRGGGLVLVDSGIT